MNIDIYILVVGYTIDGRKSATRCITSPNYIQPALQHAINMGGIHQIIHQEIRPIHRN